LPVIKKGMFKYEKVTSFDLNYCNFWTRKETQTTKKACFRPIKAFSECYRVTLVLVCSYF